MVCSPESTDRFGTMLETERGLLPCVDSRFFEDDDGDRIGGKSRWKKLTRVKRSFAAAGKFVVSNSVGIEYFSLVFLVNE